MKDRRAAPGKKLYLDLHDVSKQGKLHCLGEGAGRKSNYDSLNEKKLFSGERKKLCFCHEIRLGSKSAPTFHYFL